MNIRRAILKATDAKLRADNWQYILEVCDLVSNDPEDGGKEAIDVIMQRLEQNDANVVLRTLSLITSLAENCGSRLKQSIDSKGFTGVLHSLIKSKSVHITVKKAIATVVKQLAKSFQEDPSLCYMKDLLKQIMINEPYLLNDEQPNVPSKKEMTVESKQKEDKELEEALRLSLLEFEQQKNVQMPATQLVQRLETVIPTAPSSPTVVKKVRAMYDLTSTEKDELSFKKGDVIMVLEQVYRDWWRGTLRGKVGIFPLNYVTPIEEQTPQELQMERGKENRIFAQKASVDQLYYTLSNYKKGNNVSENDPTQNQAINNSYGSITPLRPEIAKMIGKYARKREDMVSLRQVLATAELTYNQSLDRATNAYTSSIPLRSSEPYVEQGQGQYYNYYTQQSDPTNTVPQPLQQRQQNAYRGQQPQFPHIPQYGANYGPSQLQRQNQAYESNLPRPQYDLGEEHQDKPST